MRRQILAILLLPLVLTTMGLAYLMLREGEQGNHGADEHRVIGSQNRFSAKYEGQEIEVEKQETTFKHFTPTNIVRLSNDPEIKVVSPGVGFRSAESKPVSSQTRLEPSKAIEPSQAPNAAQPQPQRVLTNCIGMKLVRIEQGELAMGTTDAQFNKLAELFPDTDRSIFNEEQPRHSVRITRPFYLGKHEVTQGEYQAVMGENPSEFKGSDHLPVESVSWLDAVMFCNMLSDRDGRKLYYRIDGDELVIAGGNGYRLPTEAEWEYACRAGHTTLYPFGDDVSTLDEHAWYERNSEGKTHAVGQKRPNAWGLCDMLGNVCEWCSDWEDEKYYATSPASDPSGPAKAFSRVFRGGCWKSISRPCRPAFRSGLEPVRRSNILGFRVATSQ